MCKKSVFARTGFVFEVCLLVKISVGSLGVSGIESASIISARILQKTVSIADIEKVVSLTKFDNITDSVDTNGQLLEAVVISVGQFLEHEAAAEEQRFKRRWVQSNTFTDRLARDKRLFSFVELAVQESLSPSVARVRRQISNSEVLDEVITFIHVDMLPQVLAHLREECIAGTDGFNGGLVGAEVTCDPCALEDRFRRIDGVCNNLAMKLHGAAGTPLRRLASPAYSDGVSAPRHVPDSSGLLELSARAVSNHLHKASTNPFFGELTGPDSTKGFSHMAMQFGQFLDHDITITPQAGGCQGEPQPSPELDCCNATLLAVDQALHPTLRRCLNIPLDPPAFPGLSCLSFTR